MFERAGRLGAYCPGLDPAIVRACQPYWPQFAQEMYPVVAAALQTRWVAVDIDVLGRKRMERQAHYQRMMRPHGGTSTALVCLVRRGVAFGTLVIGRTRGRFSDGELEHLRALAPTLSVCDAAVASHPGPPASEPDGAERLTRRERDVLSYLHLGYTNAQIASALGTAERTVRNQLSSSYEKLGVASRAEAAVVSVQLGLAPIPAR